MHLCGRNLLAISWLVYSVCPTCVADDPVHGPPTLVIDARIDDGEGRKEKRFIGNILQWGEAQQSWYRESEIRRGSRSASAAFAKDRSVLILQSKRMVASLSTLRFMRLNGDVIDKEDIPKLLQVGRAVVFLHQGCAIHPAIAKSLHPETVVVQRISYPNVPLIIPLPDAR